MLQPSAPASACRMSSAVPAWAEHFGTRHLGSLRGITSVVGIFGAAAGPVPFAAWPPQVGYVIFLAAIATAMVMGIAAAPRPVLRTETAKP